MTGNDLQPEQARQLMAIVGKQLQFLNRLCDRMQQLQFSVNDSLWRAAEAAKDAHRDLHMAAHYAGCKSGVG